MRYSCFPIFACRLLVVGTVGLFLTLATGCSIYPFGDSRSPNYYGGHGSPTRPNLFVPREVQRGNVSAE